jgi:hypothetical protein
MLNLREWRSREFQTHPCPHFYVFFVDNREHGDLCMTAVGVSSADFDVRESTAENSEWIYPEQQVARVLVDLFKEIPQVKSICAQFGDDQITVWTLLDSYDRDAREKVYGKELEVCRLLKIHNFDFRVTSADLVPPEDLVAAGSREIYNRPS